MNQNFNKLYDSDPIDLMPRHGGTQSTQTLCCGGSSVRPSFPDDDFKINNVCLKNKLFIEIEI